MTGVKRPRLWTPGAAYQVCLTIPGVDIFAIAGMPDPRLGERSCAFVNLHAGQTLTLGRLTEFLSSKNEARQSLPEKLIIMAGLPLTPAGKIQKFKLQKLTARAVC